MQTYADTCRQQGKFHTQNSKHSATFILLTSMTVKRHLNAKTCACRLHHKESGVCKIVRFNYYFNYKFSMEC